MEEYKLATNSTAMMEFYESWVREHYRPGWKSASFGMGGRMFHDLLMQYPPERVMDAINYYTHVFPGKHDKNMEISGRPLLSFPEIPHFKAYFKVIRKEVAGLLPPLLRTAKREHGATWSPPFPPPKESLEETPPSIPVELSSVSAPSESTPESRPEKPRRSWHPRQP